MAGFAAQADDAQLDFREDGLLAQSALAIVLRLLKRPVSSSTGLIPEGLRW
jgi:hypothetical protein